MPCRAVLCAEQVEARVKAGLEGEGSQLCTLWANTLHHPQDLPFKLQGTDVIDRIFKDGFDTVPTTP